MEEKFLLGKISVYVNADHRFGTDAILLAGFASPKAGDIVCDLCTGCGVIPLYFCKEKPPKKIYGVEIQQEAAELFKKSVEENGLQERVFPVNADLRDIPLLTEKIPAGSVDVVTANPPYYKENSGKERLSEAQRIARHEIACSLPDVINTAEVLLKYGGTLKICHLTERIADVFCLMREKRIEPKRLTLVCNKAGEKPWLALIEGKKGGKVGLSVEKPLVMRNEDGGYTDELMEIYK